MFKRHPVNIETVNISDDALIEIKSTQYALPYLDKFLADIATRQSGTDEAYGRRYQRDVISSAGLTTFSPFSGSPLTARHSVNVCGRVFFRFTETVEYYVASSRIKVGYPLSALFVPHANLLLKWDVVKGGVERVHIKLLKSVAGGYPSESSNGLPVILVGHRNFAHHLWNELSALERLLNDDRLPNPRPKLIIGREPLGALDTIFPELRGWEIDRSRVDRGRAYNEPGTLFVNLGGYRISSTLRQRIVQHAEALTGAEINSLRKDIREHCSPVFWLSIRTSNPTFTNQREVLVAIARVVLANYPTCCVVFDGFSLPEDWENTNGEVRHFYTSSASEARLEIDGLIESIRRVCETNSAQKLVNAGGLRVLESISLAQLADTYFCHLGTIQHKIAWTGNMPGIIHGNRVILASKPEIWHAAAIESGIVPAAINGQMVADTTPGNKSGNYQAVDCAALAEWVVEHFESYLVQNRYAQPRQPADYV